MKDFLLKLISDENNIISSKRVIAVLSGLALIVNMFIHPSDFNTEAVLILSLGCFGITGAVSIFSKKS